MNQLNSDQIPGMSLCEENQCFTKYLPKTNVFFFCKWPYLQNIQMHLIPHICYLVKFARLKLHRNMSREDNNEISMSLHVMLRKEIADSIAGFCSSENLALFINYALYANSEAEGNNYVSKIY